MARRAASPASAGTARPTSRCRSPSDVPQRVALRILEQPEDHPAVIAEQQSVRAYPNPFGINAAHVLGYLSPITEDEYDQARSDGDRSVNGASSVGRAGVEKQYDEWLRGMPGYRRVAVDSMGRVLGEENEIPGMPGDTLVTSIDAKVQSIVEQQLARDHRHRTRHPRRGHRPQLRGRLRRRRGDGGADRPGRRDGQPADVRPGGLGRRHHQEAARPALLREGRDPAARPGDAGPVRTRLDVEAVHDRRRDDARLRAGHPARLLLGLPGRQPRVQELRVRGLRARSASTARSRSRATRSSTASATTSGRSTAPTSRT